MTLSASLFATNSDLVNGALTSSFVRQLADGTLPLASFQAYIAQDAFFLQAFAGAYALALAHSDDATSLEDSAALITGAVEELGMHGEYAARWGVNLAGVEPLPATRNYTDFLMATAANRDSGEICAAMVPCMRLYAHIGRALRPRVEASNPYAEWVETYAADGFEALAVRLEGLLDRLTPDTATVRSAYRRAMQLEVEFFAAFG
jgi:thiaminase/transcriptional activator TenA